MIGVEKRGSCTSILQKTGGIVTCPFALFPDAFATLSCPFVSRIVYGTKNEIGSMNEGGLFQVNKTFIVDGAESICNTNHLCTLSVSNNFETKSYDEDIYFLCKYTVQQYHSSITL